MTEDRRRPALAPGLGLAALFALYLEAMEPQLNEAQRAALAQYNLALADLLEALRKTGVEVERLDQLGERHNDRTADVIRRWATDEDYTPLRWDVIATLGESWASVMAHKLESMLRVFIKRGDVDTAWFVGCAIQQQAKYLGASQLIPVVQNQSYGRARIPVVLGLATVPDKDAALDALLPLLADESMRAAAIEALGKLGVADAAAAIRPYLTSSDGFVRAKSIAAINRLRPG